MLSLAIWVSVIGISDCISYPKVELAKSFSLKCQSLSEGVSGKTEEHLEMAKI